MPSAGSTCNIYNESFMVSVKFQQSQNLAQKVHLGQQACGSSIHQTASSDRDLVHLAGATTQKETHKRINETRKSLAQSKRLTINVDPIMKIYEPS